MHVIYLHLPQTSHTLIAWIVPSLYEGKENRFLDHWIVYSVVDVQVLSIVIGLKDPMKQQGFKQAYISLDILCDCFYAM